MTSELRELADIERTRLLDQARLQLGRNRPGTVVAQLAINVALPVIALIMSVAIAPDFFTSSVWHMLILVGIVALFTGCGVILSQRYRHTSIEREAERLLREAGKDGASAGGDVRQR